MATRRAGVSSACPVGCPPCDRGSIGIGAGFAPVGWRVGGLPEVASGWTRTRHGHSRLGEAVAGLLLGGSGISDRVSLAGFGSRP